MELDFDILEEQGILQDVLRELESEICKESYWDFFKTFWNTVSNEKLVENWHLKYLCDELEVVGKRIIARQEKLYDLIVNIPPSESKSTIITQLFPAWLWANDPSIRIINGSYSGTIAARDATKTRDCVKSDKYISLFPHVEIKKDQDGKTYYATTKGGDRFSSSVGSALTGQHGLCNIVDDPINPQQAESIVKRLRANDWVTQTLPSRKVDEKVTVVIVVMQRIHNDDPTAKFMERNKNVKHIYLPATSEYPISFPNDKVEFQGVTKTIQQWYDEADGCLNLVRKPKSVLKKKLKEMGSRAYAGQYGQQPKAKGGNIIKRKHLQVIPLDRVPERAFLTKKVVADTAYTEKTQNDPSGVLCFGKANNNIYLFDFKKFHLEFSDLIRALIIFIKRNKATKKGFYVEPKANGLSVIQVLRKHTSINAIEYEMRDGDKISRAYALQPFLEALRVFLVEGEWNEDFIEQCTSFPNAAHDEEVDVLGMAIDLGLMPARGEIDEMTGYTV